MMPAAPKGPLINTPIDSQPYRDDAESVKRGSPRATLTISPGGGVAYPELGTWSFRENAGEDMDAWKARICRA
jgi:hypothetical protein